MTWTEYMSRAQEARALLEIDMKDQGWVEAEDGSWSPTPMSELNRIYGGQFSSRWRTTRGAAWPMPTETITTQR